MRRPGAGVGAVAGIMLVFTLSSAHPSAAKAAGGLGKPKAEELKQAAAGNRTAGSSEGAPEKARPAPEQAGDVAESATSSEEQRIVYTFEDEAGMREFASLWQAREAILTRMAVLQAYWNQEQVILNQSNQKLSSQYNLDVAKSYTLDANRKVLIEREGALQPPSLPNQEPQQTSAPVVPPTGSAQQ